MKRHLRRYLFSYIIILIELPCFYILMSNRLFSVRNDMSDSRILEDRISSALKRLQVRSYLIETLPSIISFSSKKYNVDWRDIVTTIMVESSFREYALGDSIKETTQRARGFGQHLPSTGEWIADRIGMPWKGPETLDNPIFSIQATAFYVAEEYIIWGSQEKMVKGYFLGDHRLHGYYEKDPLALVFYKEQDADGHWRKYRYYYNLISDI
jgi:hypothetical protein